MPGILLDEIEHPKFGSCVRLANPKVQLLVPKNFGPRLLHYGFRGGANELCDHSPFQKSVAGETWSLVGGHRFWHSPEMFPRTYMPDNQPVTIIPVQDGMRVIQPEEKWVQIKKELEITFIDNRGTVRLDHRLTNKNAWDIDLALWGITLLAPGGEEWIPQASRETGYLSNRHVALWPYSRMDDRRLQWGQKYIRVRQDPDIPEPCKIGLNNEDGWAAYFNHGNMFVKSFRYLPERTYPDGGCSYETYLSDYMVEMESLSPVHRVKVEQTITHTEYWSLFRDIEVPRDEDGADALFIKAFNKHRLMPVSLTGAG